jgi:hypothetical protein
MIVAGIAYTLEPFVRYLSPDFSAIIAPVLLVLVMGELVFMVWITFKGAKIPA